MAIETKNPEITLKEIPDDVHDMIIDKQAELKKTRCSANKSQTVIILLKELLKTKKRG